MKAKYLVWQMDVWFLNSDKEQHTSLFPKLFNGKHPGLSPTQRIRQSQRRSALMFEGTGGTSACQRHRGINHHSCAKTLRYSMITLTRNNIFLTKWLQIQSNSDVVQEVPAGAQITTQRKKRESWCLEERHHSFPHLWFFKFPLLHPPTVISTVSLSHTSSSLLNCCHVVVCWFFWNFHVCHDAHFSSSSALKKRREETL